MNVHSVTGSTIRRFMVRPREGDKRARILMQPFRCSRRKASTIPESQMWLMSPESRVARSTYTLRAKMTCSSPCLKIGWKRSSRTSGVCSTPKRMQLHVCVHSSVSIGTGRSRPGVGRYSHRRIATIVEICSRVSASEILRIPRCCRRYFESGIRSGQFRTDIQPKVWRRALFGALDEVTLMWVACLREGVAPPSTLAEAASTICNLMLSGLMKPEPIHEE